MAVIDLLAVAVRLILYCALGLSFGFPLFWLYGVAAPARAALPLRGLVAASALIGLAASLIGLAVLAASMSGVPVTEVDRASLLMVATMPGIGTAWLVRVTALVLVAAIALIIRPARPFAMAATSLGGIALASLAWTGHAGMSEGSLHSIHLGADIAHLLAGAAWLGALSGLIMLAASTSTVPATLHLAAANFAVTGSVIVGVLVVTGLINAWAIVGPDRIMATLGGGYGQLLAVKLLLFAAMLGLATRHRFVLTPRLAGPGNPDEATAVFRRSLVLEAAAAIVILAVVAMLGLLDPVGAA